MGFPAPHPAGKTSAAAWLLAAGSVACQSAASQVTAAAPQSRQRLLASDRVRSSSLLLGHCPGDGHGHVEIDRHQLGSSSLGLQSAPEMPSPWYQSVPLVTHAALIPGRALRCGLALHVAAPAPLASRARPEPLPCFGLLPDPP